MSCVWKLRSCAHPMHTTHSSGSRHRCGPEISSGAMSGFSAQGALACDDVYAKLLCLGLRRRARWVEPIFTPKCYVCFLRRARWLAPHDASWCFRAPLAASWRFLAPPGASWRLLALPGASWRLMVLFGASWCFIARPGASWCFLAPPGASWCFLALPAASARQLAPGSTQGAISGFSAQGALACADVYAKQLCLGFRRRARWLAPPGASWCFQAPPAAS